MASPEFSPETNTEYTYEFVPPQPVWDLVEQMYPELATKDLAGEKEAEISQIISSYRMSGIVISPEEAQKIYDLRSGDS